MIVGFSTGLLDDGLQKHADEDVTLLFAPEIPAKAKAGKEEMQYLTHSAGQPSNHAPWTLFHLNLVCSYNLVNVSSQHTEREWLDVHVKLEQLVFGWLTAGRVWLDPGRWFLGGVRGCTGWFCSAALPHCCSCCHCWWRWCCYCCCGWGLEEPCDGWKGTHTSAGEQTQGIVRFGIVQITQSRC